MDLTKLANQLKPFIQRWIDGSSGSIAVEEADGTPSVVSVTKIKVANGTLTDEGSGVVSLSASPSAERMAVWTVDGALTVETGKLRIYNHTGFSLTVTRVSAAVGSAAAGAAVIVDVNKNGTTILTTPLSIAIGDYSATTTGIATSEWANGEYLTMDVDQISTGVGGTDLVVQVTAEQDATITQAVNADTLDGEHASAFADASHTHTESDITDLDHDAAKLQGRALANTAPSDGQAIVWDNAGSTWKPGTVSGGSGSVATDAIWDAAGDLAVGTGANTAGRMAMGTAGKVLAVKGDGSGLEWATPTGGTGATDVLMVQVFS